MAEEDIKKVHDILKGMTDKAVEQMQENMRRQIRLDWDEVDRPIINNFRDKGFNVKVDLINIPFDPETHTHYHAPIYGKSVFQDLWEGRWKDEQFGHRGTEYNSPKPTQEWEHPKTRRLDKQVEGLRFLDPITNILWNATFDYPMCYLHRINQDGTGQLDRSRLCSTKEEMGLIKTRLEYVLKASGTHWRHWEQV